MLRIQSLAISKNRIGTDWSTSSPSVPILFSSAKYIKMLYSARNGR